LSTIRKNRVPTCDGLRVGRETPGELGTADRVQDGGLPGRIGSGSNACRGPGLTRFHIVQVTPRVDQLGSGRYIACERAISGSPAGLFRDRLGRSLAWGEQIQARQADEFSGSFSLGFDRNSSGHGDVARRLASEALPFPPEMPGWRSAPLNLRIAKAGCPKLRPGSGKSESARLAARPEQRPRRHTRGA
jgi:hypothetical protein